MVVFPIIFSLAIIPFIILTAVVPAPVHVRSVKIIPVVISPPVSMSIRVAVVITAIPIPVNLHAGRRVDD